MYITEGAKEKADSRQI